MDLLWMILFLLCAEAENLTEVRVELGHSVTLNCSLTATDLYWYMEMHSQLRALIARTYFRDPSSTQYYVDNTVISKYQALENRLVITNITSEDCRLYFCARKINNSIVLEDAFRMLSGLPVTPSTNNSEANNNHQQQIWQSELILFSSFALNVLFIMVITGLLFASPCLKMKNCNCQVNEASPFTCENPEALNTPQYSCCVYEEIQLPTFRAPPSAASSPELPRSRLPRHRLGHLGGF